MLIQALYCTLMTYYFLHPLFTHGRYCCQRAKLNLHNLILQLMQNKSVCVRIGPRCYSKCASLVTSDGKDLVWVVTSSYLGVFVTRSKHFSCSFDNAKRSLYVLTQSLVE